MCIKDYGAKKSIGKIRIIHLIGQKVSFARRSICLCDKDFAEGMLDVIENNTEGEDKFIAAFVLANEIARTLNGISMC